MLGIVGRVTMSIMDDDLAEIERRNALQASSINPELVGVRAALVMRVNAADRAEMVVRSLCVEAIRREIVIALQDPELGGRRR
jgi:hypothetical protein